MAYVIKNGKTNLQQEAHIHQPTHAHSHFTRAVAAMDSCIALIEAHQMTKPSGQWTGETRVSKTRLLQRRVRSTPWSVSSTPRPWIGVCVPLALIKFVLIKNNSIFSNACLKKCNISHSFVCLEGRSNHTKNPYLPSNELILKMSKLLSFRYAK